MTNQAGSVIVIQADGIEDMVPVSVMIPKQVFRLLRKHAKRRGWRITDTVAEIIARSVSESLPGKTGQAVERNKFEKGGKTPDGTTG